MRRNELQVFFDWEDRPQTWMVSAAPWYNKFKAHCQRWNLLIENGDKWTLSPRDSICHGIMKAIYRDYRESELKQ